MKKVSASICIGISMLFFTSASAQVFTSKEKELISEIKKLMNDDELTDVVEAENSIEEGNFILGQVDNQEFEIDKYFEKGSTPKAEKKSVNVKAQRIDAARAHDRAFVLLQNAFETRLSKAKWQFDEDMRSAAAMRNNATAKMEEGTKKSEDYKYLGEKDLATYPYADLKTNIDAVNATYMEAIRLQFDAYRLLIGQQDKKQMIADDNFAWGIAQRDNTKDSYQTYLGKYASGIHTEEAQAAIDKLNSGQAPVVAAAPAEAPKPAAPVAAPAPVAVSGIKPKDEPVAVAEKVAVAAVAEVAQAATPAKPVASAAVAAAPAPAPKPTPAPAPKPAPKPSPVVAKAPAPAPATTALQTAIPGVVYRVQFIAVRRELEDAEVTALYSGSEKVSFRIEDGLHKYCIGEFATFAQARDFTKTIDMPTFIVVFKDGERVTMSQARK